MTTKQFDVVGLGASTVDVITLVDRFPTGRATQQALAMTIQGGGPVATAATTTAFGTTGIGTTTIATGISTTAITTTIRTMMMVTMINKMLVA